MADAPYGVNVEVPSPQKKRDDVQSEGDDSSLDSTHVIEEEIVYNSKGKQRIKKNIVKLREFEIKQPDYGVNGTCVYHLDKTTLLHEDCLKYEVITRE